MVRIDEQNKIKKSKFSKVRQETIEDNNESEKTVKEIDERSDFENKVEFQRAESPNHLLVDDGVETPKILEQNNKREDLVKVSVLKVTVENKTRSNIEDNMQPMQTVDEVSDSNDSPVKGIKEETDKYNSSYKKSFGALTMKRAESERLNLAKLIAFEKSKSTKPQVDADSEKKFTDKPFQNFEHNDADAEFRFKKQNIESNEGRKFRVFSYADLYSSRVSNSLSEHDKNILQNDTSLIMSKDESFSIVGINGNKLE